MKNILRLSKVLIASICLTLLLSNLSVASAEQSSVYVTEKEAISAALYHVIIDRSLDSKSQWKNHKMKADNPISVYDMTGELTSYIVNIKNDTQGMGYVEINAMKDENPILSYSYEASRLIGDQASRLNTKKINKKIKEKNIKEEKYVSLYPGEFGVMVEYEDETLQVIGDYESLVITKEDRIKIKKEKAKKENTEELWKKINKLTTSEIGTNNDGVTDILSHESGFSQKIFYDNSPNTGDINQYRSPSYWNGLSGCSPTSAANVFAPWIAGGFTKLQAVSQQQMIMELREDMGTVWNETTDEGLTIINNIAIGMAKYARDHGYSGASAVNHFSPTWSTVKTN